MNNSVDTEKINETLSSLKNNLSNMISLLENIKKNSLNLVDSIGDILDDDLCTVIDDEKYVWKIEVDDVLDDKLLYFIDNLNLFIEAFEEVDSTVDSLSFSNEEVEEDIKKIENVLSGGEMFQESSNVIKDFNDKKINTIFEKSIKNISDYNSDINNYLYKSVEDKILNKGNFR